MQVIRKNNEIKTRLFSEIFLVLNLCHGYQPSYLLTK